MFIGHPRYTLSKKWSSWYKDVKSDVTIRRGCLAQHKHPCQPEKGVPPLPSAHKPSSSPLQCTSMTDQKASSTTRRLKVLTANVGNSSLGCTAYGYKLCYKDVEKRIAHALTLLEPDLVAFQELLPPERCASVPKDDPKKVCADPQVVPQVRRLLGDKYSIVCDQYKHFTCIALKVDKGTFVGCPRGELRHNARTIHIPGCDHGFSISVATVHLDDGFVFDVVNAHLHSVRPRCRVKMLSRLFRGDEQSPPLIEQPNVLLMGDYNIDPWRTRDRSVRLWKAIFAEGWMGNDFRYHSGIAEHNPPRYTFLSIFGGKTIDLVVSNFAKGVCAVLGETPNTFRLDGGKGMDHRAVYGTLFF